MNDPYQCRFLFINENKLQKPLFCDEVKEIKKSTCCQKMEPIKFENACKNITVTHYVNLTIYSDHFLSWLNKYFKPYNETKVFSYKSKRSGEKFTMIDLEKKYKKAMLISSKKTN